MATRSNIGIEREDGTVDYVYCHWDGYPSNNGRILQESYTDPELIKKMVALGAISSLRRKLDAEGDSHSFDSPKEDVTIFYCRDRGEGLDLRNGTYGELVGGMEEYAYVFKPSDNQWYMTTVHDRCGMWRPLSEVLEEEG